MTIPVLALLLCGCRPDRDASTPDASALPPLPRRAELQGLSDSALEETLYEWTLRRIGAEDSLFEQDREIVLRLPSGYLDLYATRVVEEELDEGGVAQMLGSVNRRFLPDAIRAYRRMGAEGHARLLRRALAAVRRGKGILDWNEGVDLGDLPPDSLDRDLDRRLAALREDAPGLRALWIRHHLLRFVQR
jgi:hypothetical protein